MQVQKQTFLCAECSRDTPAERLDQGPEYVFCTASCAKRFRKRGYAEARRQLLLAVWHWRARVACGVMLTGRHALMNRWIRWGGPFERFIDTLSSPDVPPHWVESLSRMLDQKE